MVNRQRVSIAAEKPLYLQIHIRLLSRRLVTGRRQTIPGYSRAQEVIANGFRRLI